MSLSIKLLETLLYREKISKRDFKSHERDLILLIKYVDNFYYEFLKPEARNILKAVNPSLSASEKERFRSFIYILQERAAKAVKIPENLNREEVRKKFIEEFDKNFGKELAIVLKT